MIGSRRYAWLLALVVLAACSTQAGGGGKPTIKRGSTNFSEQLIVAELYGQVLEANGYTVDRKLNLGNREIVAPALESGQIDLYPEYLATYVTFITKDSTKATSDPGETYKILQDALGSRGLTALDFAPAVDTNGFVVTRAMADKNGLTKVSDLARLNGQLTLGGPPECPTRPFCLLGLQHTYGLQLKEFKPLDAGGPLTVAALEGNQIDVALLFTSDAVIKAKNLVLLDDDKHLQRADNVVPVVRDTVLNQAPADFKTLINGVSAKITTDELTGLNKQVGVDKQDPKTVAAAWLKGKGLVK